MQTLTPSPIHKRCLKVIIAIIALDQLTKYIALATLSQWTRQPVFEGFNLSLTWNTGVSFGLFQGSENGALWLSLLALAICSYLSWWMWKSPHKGEAIPLAMVIGGALGNVIDRINHGAVVDFIDLYIGEHHWPAFNIADASITCGVIALVLYPIFNRNKEG